MKADLVNCVLDWVPFCLLQSLLGFGVDVYADAGERREQNTQQTKVHKSDSKNLCKLMTASDVTEVGTR